jgi:hypothetical protein
MEQARPIITKYDIDEKTRWLKSNASIIAKRLKETTESTEQIMTGMKYTEKEKQILRWVFGE